MRGARANGFLLGLTALIGCTSLKAGDVLPADAAVTDAAVTGLGGDGACAHAEPPAPPTGPAASDVPEADYVFALRYLDVGDGPAADGSPRYRAMGYDLDHTCTGQGEASSCAAPSWLWSSVEDGPAGRDHSANYLFFEGASVSLGEQRALFGVEQDALDGKASFALHIRGYNGRPDDPQVEVDAFSVTLWPTQTQGPAANWDGHDAWRIASPWLERDEGGALRNDRPLYHDVRAYVVGGTFVAHLQALRLGFAYLPAGVMQDVIVSGRLVFADGAWSVQDGILAGRWAVDGVDGLLNFLARDAGEQPATTVCRDADIYRLLRDSFCKRVDLSSRADPAAPCDSISVVFGFAAGAASLGEPLEIPTVASPPCGLTGCDGAPAPAPL